MKRLNKILGIGLLILVLSFSFQNTYAHCEVPCGIYGDSLRVELIKEHITTIEKSMKMIEELSKAETVNYNQLVRWVNNKEEHAEKLQEIVSQYFLHQRIKPADPDNEAAYKLYTNQLELLHRLLVYSMKAKQTTDLGYVEKLNMTIEKFEHLYFEKHVH